MQQDGRTRFTNLTSPPSLFQEQQLSEFEEAVLRELRTDQIIKLIKNLKTDYLDNVFDQIAPDVVKRVKVAIDSQYSTLEEPAGPSDISDTLSPEEAAEAEQEIQRLIGVAADPAATAAGSTAAAGITPTPEVIAKMASVTPLRLAYEERFMLRLLEATLEVSEYTDKVDVLSTIPAARRMAREIKEICSILSGLVVANHYEAGQRLVTDRSFLENSVFFQEIFELGRRYKILNPEKMRSSYGKLIYFLMDTRRNDVRNLLDFDCIIPVKTVGEILARKSRGQEFLQDPLLPQAIKDVDGDGKSRNKIQSELRVKQLARQKLIAKYANKVNNSNNNNNILTRITQSIFRSTSSPQSMDDSGGLEEMTQDEVEQCIYSLSDYMVFLRFNRDPVNKMIKYLEKYFSPDKPEGQWSLAIHSGKGGARLDHSHSRQYNFAHQSLTLWREVLHDMIPLWTLAEKDLLSTTNPYRLCDTGQGLNRMQAAPYLYRAMSRIINKVQNQSGVWLGSSALHLGDHNVPNALVFIDKYLQVPRILGPIVLVIESIPRLYEKPGIQTYIDEIFGGPVSLTKTILADFFRHGFDGSGADNFYDAGSCIDGRLTSAWNWCSKIESKPFFPIFLLAGFHGFDGRF